MSDNERIINNVQSILDQNGTEAEVNAYLAEEKLTADQFRRLVTVVRGGKPAPGEEEESGGPGLVDLAVDAFKQQVTSTVGLIGEIGARVGAGGPGAVNYATPQEPILPGVSTNIEKEVGSALGVQGLKPTPGDLPELAASGGGAGLADPLTWMFPLSAGLRTGKAAVDMIASLMFTGSTGFGAGAGAAVGGAVGKESFGAAGDLVGSIAGGVGGGVLPVLARIPTTAAVSAAAGVVGAAGREGAERFGAAQGNRAVRNRVEAAVTADPNTVDRMSILAEAADRVGLKLPAGVGDNAVLNSAINVQATRNPAFRQQYQSQLDAAHDAVGLKAREAFGDAGDAAGQVSGTRRPPGGIALDVAHDAAEATHRAAMQKITALVLKDAKENPQQLGRRAVALLDKQEEMARSKVSHLYKDAFDQARAVGDGTVPEAALANLREMATHLNDKEFMRALPREVRALVQRLDKSIAKKADADDFAAVREGSEGQLGPSTVGAKEAEKPFTLEDLDHLKRYVNRELRVVQAGSPREGALRQLKRDVVETIEQLPEEFVTAYKAADAAYLAKVGLPHDMETIRQMGRAKFEENVLPIITRNGTSADAWLNVTGARGKVILRAALAKDLEEKAVGGVISPQALEKWLAGPHGQAATRLGDGFVDRLKKSQNALVDVVAEQTEANAKYLEDARQLIVTTYGRGAHDLGQELLTSPANVDRFMLSFQAAKDPDALRALQSIAMDTALSQKNPLEWLMEPGRAEAASKLFGNNHLLLVHDLAQLQEGLNAAKLAKGFDISAIPQDALHRATGIPLTTGFSVLRNQIWSGLQKVMSLTTKSWTELADRKTQRAINEALLDGPGLQAHLKAVRAAREGDELNRTTYLQQLGSSSVGVRWLVRLGGGIASDAGTAATRGAAIGVSEYGGRGDPDRHGAPPAQGRPFHEIDPFR